MMTRQRMQLSNWDARPLSPQQLTYAAVDAFSLVAMVHAMYVQSGSFLYVCMIVWGVVRVRRGARYCEWWH